MINCNHADNETCGRCKPAESNDSINLFEDYFLAYMDRKWEGTKFGEIICLIEMCNSQAKAIQDLQSLVDLHSAELKDCNEREVRVRKIEKLINNTVTK